MREVVLDTETTGLDPAAGHRVVEIGCIELVNHVATDNRFHVYLNPERSMPEEAYAVHGLGDDFLAEQPLFKALAEDFLAFIGEDPLVIHNAEFDVKFLNWELKNAGLPPLSMERTVDTVKLARQRYPGAQASLDALCRRFEIDNSMRTLHGALLDCELLAEVYLELMGGRQPDFALDAGRRAGAAGATAERRQREPRPHAAPEAELAAHEAMLAKLTDPIWLKDD
jgi:DNA polymerase-3 subunit epsilon